MTKKPENKNIEEKRDKSQLFKDQIFSLARAGIVFPATEREKETFNILEQAAFNIAREGTCEKILRASVIFCGEEILSYGANHSSDKQPCGEMCVRKRKNQESVCYYSEHSEETALKYFLKISGDYTGKQVEIYNFKFWKVGKTFKGIPNNSLSPNRSLNRLLEKNITTGIYRIFEGKGGVCSVDLVRLRDYRKGALRCNEQGSIKIRYNYKEISGSGICVSP